MIRHFAQDSEFLSTRLTQIVKTISPHSLMDLFPNPPINDFYQQITRLTQIYFESFDVFKKSVKICMIC